jgi:Skp family chaperone for outer membrane proteins
MKTMILGALVLASAAVAPLSTAAAQSAGPQNPGPVIPGVCVYFNQRLLAQSTAGQSVQSRMEQLATEVQNEIAPYAQAIQTQAQQLQSAGPTLPADQLQAQRQQLQQRVNEAQQLEQTRDNELRYTLSEQRRRISEAVEPILVQAYQERGCGILLDRESVFIMNPQHDVTDLVIQRLNTALPSLSFNRLPIPAQQQQQPVAAQ